MIVADRGDRLVGAGVVGQLLVVEGERLGVALDDPEVRLERPAPELVEELVAVGPAVRQAGDGEVALGDHVERRVLAEGVAAVADDAHAVDVAQHPADPDGVAEGAARRLDGRLLHLREQLLGQHLGAVGRPPVAEVEAGPGDQVAGVGRDAAGRVAAAGQRPRPGHRDRAVGVLVVADGEAPRHDLVGEEEAVVEPERLEEQLPDRLLVGLAGDLLDDPAGDRQRGVVVRHGRRRAA